MKILKLEKHVFKLSTDYIKEIEEEPINFMVLHESYHILEEFHYKGCWVGLICNLNFTNFEIDNNFSIKNIVDYNLEYINTKGRIHNIACSFFFQVKIIYNLINEIRKKLSLSLSSSLISNVNINQISINNNDLLNTNNTNLFSKVKNSDLLTNLIKEKNIIIVITLIKVLFAYSNYKKSRFVRSSDKVLFIPHIGGDDINVNGDFHAILQRIIYAHDIIYYQKLINNIEDTIRLNPTITLLDEFNNNDIFIERKCMSDFIRKFVNSDKILELNDKYELTVKFPESVYLNLTQFTNLPELDLIMKEHKLKLPVILKFEGDKDSEMKHLMIIIISTKGLINFKEYCNKFNKDGNLL